MFKCFSGKVSDDTKLGAVLTYLRYLMLSIVCAVGSGFSISCFYCGLAVRHMTSDRDPWVAHAQLEPGCPHVLNVKGFRFVNDVAIILDNPHRLKYGLESKKI